ncbi:MAG: GDP-mannose 4,6-dehydratase [Thermoplasmata archaeon]
MRLLITGGSGFIGRYLCALAAERGHEVIATYLSQAELDALPPLSPSIRWRHLNMRDRLEVDRTIDEIRPEGVFHLAAQAYASVAWKDPQATFDTNVLGTIHLYEALRRHPPEYGTFLASSASAYGAVSQLPMREDSVLNPINPYGVSKACQDMLSLQYSLNFGLRIVRGRLFITTGPSKTGDAVSDFARRVVRLERAGKPASLPVGNLTPKRDISDVRDIIQAIWKVFESGDAQRPVNIGAGASFSMQGIIDQLVGLAQVPLTASPDPALFRPTDEPEIRADVTRLRALGITPKFTISQTVEDVLAYWREHWQNA